MLKDIINYGTSEIYMMKDKKRQERKKRKIKKDNENH